MKQVGISDGDVYCQRRSKCHEAGDRDRLTRSFAASPPSNAGDEEAPDDNAAREADSVVRDERHQVW